MDLKSLSKRVHVALDTYSAKIGAPEFRDHLGGSEIGQKCERKLWYGFRWANLPTYTKEDEEGEIRDISGPMARLFERGHSEEDRLIRLLEGVGFGVQSRDPETGNQYRIHGTMNHFGGSLDAILTAPEWLFSDRRRMLGEFKTYGKKAFAKLREFGLGNLILNGRGRPYPSGDVVKGEHVAQMNTYGTYYDFDLALYLAIEKDTDEIYVELREIDKVQGANNFVKAERIIRSPVAPERISRDPTVFECRFCHHAETCHRNAAPSQRNCRSCQHSQPIENANWGCRAYGQIIPREVLVKGCANYRPIL